MKQKVVLSIAAVLIVLVGGYFLFFFDSGKSTETETENISADTVIDDGRMEKQRQQLAAEEATPQSFVAVTIDPKKNLFGETVIEGKISNNAEFTSYKDFELMIHWNDEAGQVMDSALEVVMEGLDPGESTEFKTKRKGPRRSKSITMSLRAAKASVD